MTSTTCNICGCGELKFIQSIEAIKYDPERYFDLFQCPVCGLTFIYPMPDIGANNKIYFSDNYSPHDISLAKPSAVRRKFVNKLRELIFCRGNRSHLIYFVHKLYNTFTYRSVPYYIPNGKILDIGCGLGYYLQMMKKMGWQEYGVELNQHAVQFAKENLGLNVQKGRFEDAEFPENHFDIITLWHSLEHSVDPKYVLQKAKKYLKPEGSLFLGIPNFNSADHLLFKKYWNGFEIPLHIYHFTPETIKYLLQRAGFDNIHVFHTIRPSDMAKSIINMTNHFLGKKTSVPLQASLALLFIWPAFSTCLLQRSSIIKIIASPA